MSMNIKLISSNSTATKRKTIHTVKETEDMMNLGDSHCLAVLVKAL